jgi:Amt family ammonium transporter
VGPLGAIVIGALASLCCVWGVTGLKKLLRADDALDVFGVHGIGGIVGALLTGVFTAPALGGTGAAGFPILRQLGVQVLGVGLTVLWSGVVSVLALLLVKLVFGLRVPHEAEREGLDITSHGESAYDG